MKTSYLVAIGFILSFLWRIAKWSFDRWRKNLPRINPGEL